MISGNVIAYDLILAHFEVFHPALAELFYLEEVKRIYERKDNNPVIPIICL